MAAGPDPSHEQDCLCDWRCTRLRQSAQTFVDYNLKGGGSDFLAEMQACAGSDANRPLGSLAASALGDNILGLLGAQKSHILVDNLLFVHAGIKPTADLGYFVSVPWTELKDAQWAWIREEFLTWQGGFNGRIVVHGHTPPDLFKALTGQADPHRLVHARLSLDGGTSRSGCVAAAQLEYGRYRIITTCTHQHS